MDFISKYGYWAVFLGAMIEGESIILTAGVLAQQGVLSLGGIMLVSFLGTLGADQLLYQVGRKYGPAILQRWPSLKTRAEKAFELLHKHNTLFILSFRFIYGIRTISPIIIGMSGVPLGRFAFLNFIAAAIWSVLSCLAGYLIGESIFSFYAFAKDSPWILWTAAVFLLLLLGGGIFFYRRRRAKRLLTSKDSNNLSH